MDKLVYTAASGLRTHMAAQAAIANNMANASTTGYRADRVLFDRLELKGPGLESRAPAGEASSGSHTTSATASTPPVVTATSPARVPARPSRRSSWTTIATRNTTPNAGASWSSSLPRTSESPTSLATTTPASAATDTTTMPIAAGTAPGISR